MLAGAAGLVPKGLEVRLELENSNMFSLFTFQEVTMKSVFLPRLLFSFSVLGGAALSCV